MAPSDSENRSSKTPRKRAASTPITGEAPARKRTTKKTADAAPVAAAPKYNERPAVAASMSRSSQPGAPPAPASSMKPIASSQSEASTGTTSLPAGARPVPLVTGARRDPALATVVDADERRRMVQDAAYHKFLERGPGNGDPAQDWIEAEAEIDALLAEQRLVRMQ